MMTYDGQGNGFSPENNNYNNMNSGADGYFQQQYLQPSFVPMPVWAREKSYIRKLSLLAGGSILLYIIISGIYVAVFQGVSALVESAGSKYAPLFAAVTESSEFQYLFNTLYSIIAVGGPFFVMGYIFRKKGLAGNIPMGVPKKAAFLPVVVFAGFGLCFVGNIITTYLDVIIEMLTGSGLDSIPLPETPKNPLGIFLFFLSTAVVPALIEEVALRGIIMQPLRRYGDWYAILCSALIFGLMHCNLVQIPFAMIAGIVIGYAVIVTESVWTGVIIHFLNNGFSVLVSIMADFYGPDSIQSRICNIVYYVIMVSGCACAYFVYKKFRDTPMKTSPLINSGKKFYGNPPLFSARISQGKLYKAYIFTVPMIAAFAAVCYETVLVLMYS